MKTSRRRLLLVAGATAAVATAGCSGVEDDSESSEDVEPPEREFNLDELQDEYAYLIASQEYLMGRRENPPTQDFTMPENEVWKYIFQLQQYLVIQEQQD